jgi:hypothetical protein
MSLELIPLCIVDATLSDPIYVGDSPSGHQLIVELSNGVFQGERLNGKSLGVAGADWITISGSVGTLDVRTTMETDDGAIIFVQYRGRTEIGASPGSSPLYVAPLFETGDDRYAWINVIQCVGKGIAEGNELHYEWFEIR